jgi:hypothetical protein
MRNAPTANITDGKWERSILHSLARNISVANYSTQGGEGRDAEVLLFFHGLYFLDFFVGNTTDFSYIQRD